MSMYHKRSYNINIYIILLRHHFIRKERKLIFNKLVKKLNMTADMLADILTKGLNSEKHYKFLNMLGVSIMQYLK